MTKVMAAVRRAGEHVTKRDRGAAAPGSGTFIGHFAIGQLLLLRAVRERLQKPSDLLRERTRRSRGSEMRERGRRVRAFALSRRHWNVGASGSSMWLDVSSTPSDCPGLARPPTHGAVVGAVEAARSTRACPLTGAFNSRRTGARLTPPHPGRKLQRAPFLRSLKVWAPPPRPPCLIRRGLTKPSVASWSATPSIKRGFQTQRRRQMGASLSAISAKSKLGMVRILFFG